MLSLILEKHPLWCSPSSGGGVACYYYYDEVTWIVVGLALLWLLLYLVRRYRRARALRRPSRRANYRLLRRVVRIKRELSERYLRPGFSANIHAVGIGLLDGTDQYCIQVFVNDADQELWPGAGAAGLPGQFRGVPLVLIEMPVAAFLTDAAPSPLAASSQYPKGIRERQEVIVGGISGANTNLTGQSGTIGYFCTRKSRWTRRREVHLLSNSHVFADLRKARADAGDLIMQPSPGEPASNRPIATLVNFSALKFDSDPKEPNHIDAAIAKLWAQQQHKAVIPLIGTVKGYVPKKEIEVGEAVRKFGRTTGYTEGRIFSIYLDIWILYDRVGQSAFFQNQILIEPASPQPARFVAKGDSGSLLVDAEQHAVGLIFGGMSEASSRMERVVRIDPATNQPRRVEGYGVANPISEVLHRLKIDLLV
ncbi:MAG TPA: hypothetical protein VF544_20850 [Pyrinomonadaceae bacterium]|jgi:hypothetical protein